jgi:membrane peptidoglycan carboxypeptidase
MIDKVGPQNVARIAERLGGWDSIPRLCSIALGTPTVTPLEMARAFATFAGRGARPEPIAVTRVVGPEGKVIARRSPRAEQVIDVNVADTVNEVLQDVIRKGTARGKGIGRPAAGKTGTTQNHVDAWFVGYTPSFTAAVWVGYPPDPATGKVPPMDGVRGRRVTGGSFPATIWEQFMRNALKGTEEEDFVEPEIGGEMIGEPPPPPSPEPTCVDAFGFPAFCPSPGVSPLPPGVTQPPRMTAPPPLLPLPTVLPSLPINPLLPMPPGQSPRVRGDYPSQRLQPLPGYPTPSPTPNGWP